MDFSDEESEEEIVTENKTGEPKSSTFKHRPKAMSQEVEFNCGECAYQGTRQNELQKQIQLTHDIKNIIKCSVCCENFVTNSDLKVT